MKVKYSFVFFFIITDSLVVGAVQQEKEKDEDEGEKFSSRFPRSLGFYETGKKLARQVRK